MTMLLKITLPNGHVLYGLRLNKAWAIVQYHDGQLVKRHGYSATMSATERRLAELAQEVM